MSKGNVTGEESIWEQLDDFTDAQLGILVESAIFVLKQSAEQAGPAPQEIPPGPMVQALEDLMGERGVEDTAAAGRIVQQPDLSRPVAILILKEIASVPELADEIETVWRERSDMLVVEPATIFAAALLLLVLKLKKVEVSKKKGVTVEFDKVSEGALGKILSFVT